MIKQRWSLSARNLHVLLRRIKGAVCQSLCILQCGHLVSTFRKLRDFFSLSFHYFYTFSVVSANPYPSFHFYSGFSFLRLFPFFSLPPFLVPTPLPINLIVSFTPSITCHHLHHSVYDISTPFTQHSCGLLTLKHGSSLAVAKRRCKFTNIRCRTSENSEVLM